MAIGAFTALQVRTADLPDRAVPDRANPGLLGPAPAGPVRTGARQTAPERVGNVRFALCANGVWQNCVIDGDTIRYGGATIRVADINAPETRGAKCPSERALGQRATRRLRALLNAGPFTLARVGDRDTDRYGRKLRVIRRDGRSLGAVLIAEGLARPWTGRRRSWCG